MKLTEKQASVWIACALDTDGNIGVHVRNWRNGKPVGIMPVIQFSGNYIDLVVTFKELTKTPNKITTSVNRSGTECHHVRSTKKEIILEILARCLPYLVAKKKQAELVMEFCLGRIEKGARRGTNIPYDEREIEIVAQMAELNRRGVK